MSRFSVVITTHERSALLARAIQSIKDQSLADIQIVVVSDSTCAQTYHVGASLLSGQDVFVQRKGQPGPAASRNMGLKLIEGEHVVFLDDDDAFTTDHFKTVEPHLHGRDIVYTDYHMVYERAVANGLEPYAAERRSLADRKIDDLHVKNFIPSLCLVYPRQTVERRDFNPSLVLNEDWEYLLNVATDTPFRHVPIEGPIVYSRETADNRGRTNDHLLPDTYRRIYKAWPAPTPSLKEARRDFLQANGVEAALVDL